MKKVILVSGKLRVGKNQFAEYLQEFLEKQDLRVSQDLFAKALKDGSSEDFKSLYTSLNGELSEIISMVEDEKVRNRLKALRTYKENFYEEKTLISRHLLQIYGTQIFRDRVDDDYWVKQLIKRTKESSSDVVIVTDVRFPNEIEVLQADEEIETVSVRIERDMQRDSETNEHLSETALDNYEQFFLFIDNNGTLEDLRDAAETSCEQILEAFSALKWL